MDAEKGVGLDGVGLAPQPSDGHFSQAPRAPRSRAFGVGMVIWGVLLTCLAIAGFVMAAYSTRKANTYAQSVQTLTSAILVADLNHLNLYPGYGLVTNLFRGTGYWAPRTPTPIYRSDMGVASWNNQAILVGGLSNDPANISQPIVLNKVIAYDPIFNRPPINKTDMPVNRSRFGWGVLNDKMYIFGGVDDVDGLNAHGDMYIYDFAADSWSKGDAVLSPARSDMCSAVINGKIYTMGGYDGKGNTLANIEEFDPATGKWRTLPQGLRTSRGDCGAVASGGNIYAMGGTNKPDPNCDRPDWWNCYKFQSSVERITINADGTATVASMADMLYPRGDFGIFEVSPGRILVAGGESSNNTLGVARLLAVPWVEEYDVSDNHWTPKAPLPDAAMRFGMASAGGQVLKFGGHPSCPFSPEDQSNESQCRLRGLNTVQAFTDVIYPNVYVLARTDDLNY